MPRWYCLQAYPRMEAQVMGRLAAQGLQTHWPRMVDYDRRGGPATVSMFPGYLFARFDIGIDRWQCIPSTIGVRRLFSSAPERPTPVPAGLVESLISRGRAGDGVIDTKAPAFPLEGAAVRMVAGPFESFEGICTWSSGHRVRVLLDILGRNVPVEADRADVLRLPP